MDDLDKCIDAYVDDKESGKETADKAGMQRRIRSMVKGSTDKQVRDFLTKELARNEDLRLRFEADVGKADLSGIYAKVMQMFKKAGDKRGWLDYGVHVDFGPLTKLAKSYESKEEHAEAVSIYRDMSEAIWDNMGNVFECDGYYINWFSAVVKRMASCMAKQEQRQVRLDNISYLFAKYANDKEYYEDYGDALKTVCTTHDDLLFCKSLLEKRIPDRLPSMDSQKFMDARDDIELMIAMLGRLDDESIVKFYKKYRAEMPEVCESYVRYLAKTDRAEALKVAKKSIETFDYADELEGLAHTLYEKTDPEYPDSLYRMFLRTFDWKYYDELKEISSDWSRYFDSMIDALGRFNTRVLIDMLLREKLMERAFEEALRSKSLRILQLYQDRLCPLYQDEYYATYTRWIDKFAKEARSREIYREVASYLESMKAIPNHAEEFKKFIRMLRERHARRPAFLDEVKSL